MEFNEETLKIIEKVAAATGGWNNIPGVDFKSSQKTDDCNKTFLFNNGFAVDECYDKSEGCWILSIIKNK